MALVVSDTKPNVLRFCYENLFVDADTVVASSEDSDFPVENLYDWVTSDYFKPAVGGSYTITATFSTPQTADYFAFHGHDLDVNTGTIKLEYHDGTTWQDAFPVLNPLNNNTDVTYFDEQSSLQWRVAIDSTVISSIALISFGKYMAVEYGVWNGFVPPVLARNPKTITSVSDSGVFIGRSVITQGIKTSFPISLASIDWIRTDWLPFVVHAEAKPFFATWHARHYPREHALMWADGTIKPPKHTHHNLMAMNFKVKGVVS